MATSNPTSPNASPTASNDAALTALRRDAARDAAWVAAALLATSFAIDSLAGYGPWFVPKAMAAFTLACLVAIAALHGHAPHRRFGAANRVTLIRLGLICLLAAQLGEPMADRVGLTWGVTAVAALAASLDALDGPLARWGRCATSFGARFDMECDALMVMVLSLLVVRFDKAGAWIVLAGLMRYAFVLATFIWPWMQRPVPPAQWRKAVCVLQITSLIVCIAPMVDRAWSQCIAAASLLALCASFGTDVLWLARRRKLSREATA